MVYDRQKNKGDSNINLITVKQKWFFEMPRWPTIKSPALPVFCPITHFALKLVCPKNGAI